MSALFEATALVVPFENLRMDDVESVGGKNASLGEMISQLPQGVRVPTGFATTAHAFREFLAHEGLTQRIAQRLATLDIEDVRALVYKLGDDVDRLSRASADDWWDVTKTRVTEYVDRVERSVERLDDNKS